MMGAKIKTTRTIEWKAKQPKQGKRRKRYEEKFNHMEQTKYSNNIEIEQTNIKESVAAAMNKRESNSLMKNG